MDSASKRLNLRKANFLIVDDNTQSLELISQILLGFQVGKIKGCRSGQEADEQLASTAYDLILIDGEMPDEDGYALTHRIRHEPEKPNFTTSILLVSASTSLTKILKARNAGANMVIKKPISPAVLLDRLVWLASNSRKFITSESYCGPDRRLKSIPLAEGQEERRADALALAASPERAMSQDEVDGLFA